MKTVIMSMWGGKEVSRAEYRSALETLRRGCAEYPDCLVDIPRSYWPSAVERMSELVIAVLRSRKFCCQVYDSGNGVRRLSFNRSEVELIGNVCQWKQGITWDDLQQLKAEAGYGDRQAVEIYPADEDVVNVANMRHLWVLPESLPFAWKKEAPPWA